MPYVYMIRCRDCSLYTGITTDVGRRMREHYDKKKSGAKYTRSHGIASLEMVWETKSWSDAAKLEYRIKRLSRPQKEALILHPEQVNESPALRQGMDTYRPVKGLTLNMYIEDKEEHGQT